MSLQESDLVEETDPFCLDDADTDGLLAGALWRRFAAIGDSVAAGVGDRVPGYPAGPWADRVAAALRRQTSHLAYLNTGRIGATTVSTLREQWQVVDDFHPDLLFVACGANDIWRRGFDRRRIEDDLRSLFDTATSTGDSTRPDVLTFTLGRAFVVPSVEDFPARVEWLNDRVRALAGESGVTVVEMWGHPVMTRPSLLSADRIHFSSMGQAVMASEVIKALGALLASPPREQVVAP